MRFINHVSFFITVVLFLSGSLYAIDETACWIAMSQINKKPINMIVAVSRNLIISSDGHIPWDIPADRAYFHELTKGGILIMGRITFEAIAQAGHLNPENEYLVLSRQKDYSHPQATAVSTLAQAIRQAKRSIRSIWICGGEDIYRLAFQFADKLYLTLVDTEVTGDRHFPDWHYLFKHEVSMEKKESGSYQYIHYVFER